MNRPLYKVGFCLTVALFWLDTGCASTPARISRPTKNPPINSREAQDSVDKSVSDLVGIWQGFWSLKGKVATDQYLFLQDGRWGWLATADTKVTKPVQRSGRWEMADGIVVLTELQRKERVACERDSSSVQTCEEESACKPCSAEYRSVQHNTPLVERLVIGECPDNREAIALDREYTCLTIGERIFWRKALPTKSEQDRFFEEE